MGLRSRRNQQFVWLVAGLLFLSLLSTGCGNVILRDDNPLMKATPTPGKTALLSTPTEPPLIPTPTLLPPTIVAEDDSQMIRISIVYDNYPYQAGLTTDWGFSAYITYQGENILFDTGGSGSYLISNLNSLNISPGGVQKVVLSHEHSDHTGGLQALLNAGADPILFIPPSFSDGFKNRYQDQSQLIEVKPKLEITNWAYSLGEFHGPPPEQALVIDTKEGLVIITGCAHPGVDELIVEANQQYQRAIYLVLGGFHLGRASDFRINQIIDIFQESGIQYVAPCHCTGDHAIAMFRNAFGDNFIPVGVGAVIEIDG